MLNIGIFDNTNYNYIISFLREMYNINIVNDFKLYNAFSTKNMAYKYDVLLVLSDITNQNEEKIKHVISKTKILIINNDDKKLCDIIEKMNLENIYILNYGYNPKVTVTISSVDSLENKVICMIQRDIVNIYGNIIESKEIEVFKGKSNFSNYKLLGIVTLMLVLGYVGN